METEIVIEVRGSLRCLYIPDEYTMPVICDFV